MNWPAFGAGSKALLQEQFEKIEKYQRSIEESKSKLENFLLKDIALSLCGIELRRKLSRRLRSEAILGRWESGKKTR